MILWKHETEIHSTVWLFLVTTTTLIIMQVDGVPVQFMSMREQQFQHQIKPARNFPQRNPMAYRPSPRANVFNHQKQNPHFNFRGDQQYQRNPPNIQPPERPLHIARKPRETKPMFASGHHLERNPFSRDHTLNQIRNAPFPGKDRGSSPITAQFNGNPNRNPSNSRGNSQPVHQFYPGSWRKEEKENEFCRAPECTKKRNVNVFKSSISLGDGLEMVRIEFDFSDKDDNEETKLEEVDDQ